MSTHTESEIEKTVKNVGPTDLHYANVNSFLRHVLHAVNPMFQPMSSMPRMQ
jgi:hypothetical protein